MTPYLLVLAAYLLGATPSSHWVASLAYGVDLREVGSGNLGATNTFRTLGWKAALPVMVVDVGKGWLPVWLFSRMDGAAWSWALAYGAAAIVGHVFSVWVRFQGGKGVATSTGVFLALAPVPLAVGLVVWVVLAFTTRIVSVASMTAVLAVVAATWLLPPEQGGAALLAFTAALAAFVLWAHRSNIRRLIRGEENRFGSGKDGKKGVGSPRSAAAPDGPARAEGDPA